MNRTQTVQAIVWLDAIATQAKEESHKLRHQLSADARAEFDEQGTAPTWRIPDVATVSASVSKPAVTVLDEAKFQAWVAKSHPDAIETVRRVSYAWQEKFLKALVVEGKEAADPDTGEVVPGVRVHQGGQIIGLSVRASAEAKAVFGLAAQEGLKQAALVAGPSVPIVLAELESQPALIPDGEQA